MKPFGGHSGSGGRGALWWGHGTTAHSCFFSDGEMGWATPGAHTIVCGATFSFEHFEKGGQSTGISVCLEVVCRNRNN